MQSVRFPVAAVVIASLAALIGTPAAVADSCPDVDVVFARGTGEPAGVGVIGQAFVDALRSDVGDGATVEVYPVNYPASRDYPTAVDGVADAGNHVRDMIVRCPATRMVLGGYSQGAGVIALLTSDGTAVGSAALPGLPAPLPAETGEQVAAVALFGKPSAATLDAENMPQINANPVFAAKTIDLCVSGDPICSPDQSSSIVPHLLYGVNGMTSQAADFAAQRLAQ
ncbi:MAG: cutinase family protein [Mycobacterium sp.]|nr:MAG: cutinase family protein [Mycobacterium sp.]